MTASVQIPPRSARHSMHRHSLIALFAVALLLACLGVLSVMITISGAIVSEGTVVFEGHAKSVQHPTGGIVKDLLVRDGQTVSQGDVLVRLDPTISAANLAIITKGQDELTAKRLRLQAEQSGAAQFVVPEDIAASAAADPVLASFLADEIKVFDNRLAAREGQRQQLNQRIQEILKQIDGLTQQAKAKADEIDLIRNELTGLKDLFSKKLVPQQRVSELQREEARLRGEHGQLLSSIAEADGRITETRLQILQIDIDMQNEVSSDLTKLESQYGELEERRVASEDQLSRLDIVAPIDGVVEDLAIYTQGGVIEAGATLMRIAPQDDSLVVETKVHPNDIDQIWLGQEAILRLSAFNQRTTPELHATVSLVPADLTADPRTGAQYYLVRVRLDEQEVARLKDKKIVPGMPVECFIKTGERSVLSYFAKPLSDQLHRAFRHD